MPHEPQRLKRLPGYLDRRSLLFHLLKAENRVACQETDEYTAHNTHNHDEHISFYTGEKAITITWRDHKYLG